MISEIRVVQWQVKFLVIDCSWLNSSSKGCTSLPYCVMHSEAGIYSTLVRAFVRMADTSCVEEVSEKHKLFLLVRFKS
jgi:hypothetical protein